MQLTGLTNEDLLNYAFELSDEGLRMIDKEFTVIKANQRYAEISGLDKDKIIGQKCYAMACSRNCNTTGCSLLMGIRDKQKFEQTLTLSNPQGNKKHYLFHVMPIKDEQDTVIAILESFKEITQYKESELKLSRILESIQEGVWEINYNGGNYFSESMYTMIGANPVAHEKGYPFFFSRTHPDDVPKVEEAFKRLETPGVNKFSLRIRLLHETGYYLWVRLKGSVENRNEKGLPAAIMGTHTDIDQHVQFEHELAEKEKLLSNLFEISPAGMRIVKKGKVVLANELYAKLTGHSLQHIIGSNCGDHLCSNDCKTNCGYKLLEREGENALDGEMDTQDESGKTYHLQFRVRALRDENGELTSMLQMFWDVTDLVKAQRKLQHYKEYLEELIQVRTEELKKSEERLYLAFKATNEGLWDWRIEDGTIYFSPQYYKMLGYEPNEFKADEENWKRRIHPDDLSMVNYKLDKHFAESGKSFSMDFRMQTKNGGYKWIRGRGKAVAWDEKGSITRLIGTHADIDEEKMASFAILASEKKFRNIFNTSNDSMLITDTAGNVLETNSTAIKLLGMPEEQLKQLSVNEIFDPKNKAATELFLTRLVKNEKEDILDTTIINEKGQKIYLEIAGKNIVYNDKEALLFVSRDVSERKQMQQNLMKAVYETEERERNRFAQDLHDGLGALLSGIKLQISLLNNEKVTTEKKAHILQRVQELLTMAAAQSREIANNIKPYELKMLGLIGALKSFSDKINETNALQINIHTNLQDTKLEEGTELILFRILSELINNTMKHAEASHVEIDIKTFNNKILIEYNDNGKGFIVETATTKKVAGMGLNNIKSRIESLHGRFAYHSSPGNGFTCYIELYHDK